MMQFKLKVKILFIMEFHQGGNVYDQWIFRDFTSDLIKGKICHGLNIIC